MKIIFFFQWELILFICFYLFSVYPSFLPLLAKLTDNYHITDGMNHFSILSSNCCGGLLSECFQSFGYHSTITWVYLSVNLAMYLAQQNLFTIMFFTPLCSIIPLLQICSHNNIPSLNLSISLCFVASQCSSFMVVHILLTCDIVGKTVLLKKLAHRFMSIFALSTSFIIVNAFYPDLFLQKWLKQCSSKFSV